MKEEFRIEYIKSYAKSILLSCQMKTQEQMHKQSILKIKTY